jgi:hypothetical protein
VGDNGFKKLFHTGEGVVLGVTECDRGGGEGGSKKLVKVRTLFMNVTFLTRE